MTYVNGEILQTGSVSENYLQTRDCLGTAIGECPVLAESGIPMPVLDSQQIETQRQLSGCFQLWQRPAKSSPTGESRGPPYSITRSAHGPASALAFRVVEHQSLDALRILFGQTGTQFDHVAIRVAHEHRYVTVSKCHRSLRNSNALLAQRRDRRLNVGDAKREVSDARVFLRHVHQDVLSTRPVHSIDDEIEFDTGRIPDDDDRIELHFTFDLEPERFIERE